MEVFYPFRYKDAEYNHMLKYEHAQGNDNEGTFSIYWLNQIIKIVRTFQIRKNWLTKDTPGPI